MDGVVSIPFLVMQPEGCAATREFVAGVENRVVATVTPSIARNWGTLYNPLVLYGPTGLGKTHLARGLCGVFRNDDSDGVVVSVLAADFGREYAENVETSSIDEFAQRFREADLLLVEDLQFLARKEAAQCLLSRIVDELVQAERQVIVTMTCSPATADGLDSRLRSRLVGGLSVPLSPPGVAARREIAQRMAAERGLTLSAADLDRLAGGAAMTPREIWGAIQSLQSSGTHKAIKYATGQRALSLSDVAHSVGGYFGVRIADLQGPSRRRNLTLARSIAMYLSRERTRASFNRIARYFGRSDHTTVMHACDKVRAQVANDAYVRQCVEAILAMLPPVGADTTDTSTKRVTCG